MDVDIGGGDDDDVVFVSEVFVVKEDSGEETLGSQDTSDDSLSEERTPTGDGDGANGVVENGEAKPAPPEAVRTDAEEETPRGGDEGEGDNPEAVRMEIDEGKGDEGPTAVVEREAMRRKRRERVREIIGTLGETSTACPPPKRTGRDLVGWKVAVKHFNAKRPQIGKVASVEDETGLGKSPCYFKFGVFTAIHKSTLKGRDKVGWQLKCVYDDLSHDWFESTTVDIFIRKSRIVLIEDCKSEHYEARRGRRKPQESRRSIYDHPLGKACQEKSVCVWNELAMCFYPGVVTEWVVDNFVYGVSPSRVETGRLSGLLKVRYFDGQEEWLSEDSDRIFWQNNAKPEMAKTHNGDSAHGADFSHRVGWKVAHMPTTRNSSIVKGVCTEVQGREITVMTEAGGYVIADAHACMWFRGVVDNTDADHDLVGSEIMLYSNKFEKFHTFKVLSFNAKNQKHTVKCLEGEKRVKGYYLPFQIIGGRNLCRSFAEKKKGEGATLVSVGDERLSFFGVEAAPDLRTQSQRDAIGMRVLHYDFETSRPVEGVVLDALHIAGDECIEDTSLFKVLLVDCTIKWLSRGFHIFEFTGEAGIFEFDYRCHLPLRLPIYLNGLRPVFLMGKQLVLLEGEIMSPVEFEALCGYANAKKWRQSIKIWKESDVERGKVYTKHKRPKLESQKFSVGDYLEGVIPLFKGGSSLQAFVLKGTALQMKKPPKSVSDEDEDGDEEGGGFDRESCPFAKFLDERDAKQYDIAPSIFSS